MQKRTIFFSSLVTVSLFLSACSSADLQPPKTPKEMVQESFQNSQNVKTSMTDINFKGVIAGKDKDGKTSNVDFDFAFNVGSDIVDPKMPVFTLALKGNGDMDQNKPLSVEGNVLVNKDSAYVDVTKLEGLQDYLPEDQLAQMLKQWWQIKLPEGALEEFISKNLQNSTEEKSDLLPAGLANLQRQISNGDHLENLKYVGNDTVDGETSFHYTFDLNKQLFLNLFQDESNPLLQKEMENLQKSLDSMTAKGEMWISSKQNVGVKVALDIDAPNVVDSEGSTGSMQFHMTSHVHDIGKRIKFDVPKDAKLFDLSPFLGADPSLQPAPAK